MAIVKMKRLHMLSLRTDRNELFDRMQHLGCLEVSEQAGKLTDPEWASLLHRDESNLEQQKALLSNISQALAVLDQYAPEKEGLLSPRPSAREQALYDQATCQRAQASADEINRCVMELHTTLDQISREQGVLKFLTPWLSLDVPLGFRPTGPIYTTFGMMPASVDLDAVRLELGAKAEASALYEASTDTEVHYLFFLCHSSETEAALDTLKAFGFSSTSMKDYTQTAQVHFDQSACRLKELETRAQQLEDHLRELGSHRRELQLLYDRIGLEADKESCKERLLSTDQTFFLSGWVPQEACGALDSLLQAYDCAYELRDPTEEELPDVPVKLKNGRFSRCMNTVTEMYALPAYDGIDPNPLMAPFFIFFFGMMMADMAYGLIMIFGCLLVLKKKRPRESQRNFFELFFWCGISTFFFGALTGGFFGDFIPQLLKIINPNSTFTMPALFTPLDDTVAILIGSLILGVLQIFTGMAVSVVKKCKDGNIADAVWEEFTWWIIILGLVLAIFGIGSPGGVPVVLCIGGLMLIYGSGRNAKGFGKVTALVGSVYNGVTGYFSDTLSYLRLMALMLSGSVIAQVFNTLGSVFGNVLIFVIISMIGNALNLALNLLGCYVHDLRLQCLEYFNRFYKDGGRAYHPLSIQTKYIDIIKEEQ